MIKLLNGPLKPPGTDHFRC